MVIYASRSSYPYKAYVHFSYSASRDVGISLFVPIIELFHPFCYKYRNADITFFMLIIVMGRTISYFGI